MHHKDPKFSDRQVWSNSVCRPSSDSSLIRVYTVCHSVCILWLQYRNDPKFSDRQVWANNADPDQTAPRGAV